MEPWQPDRALSIGGPAADVGGAPQAWQVLALCGDEGVNTLFDYQLLLRRDWAAEAPEAHRLLGQALDVRIELGLAAGMPSGAWTDAAPRWVHGIVSQAARLHADERGAVYALRLRPWAWRASLRGQCRAWRSRSVPDVLLELLQPVLPSASSVQLRLQASYAPRDYLVQFNQSDWECFARLAQEWGLHFWFEHREGAHDLVLADHNAAFGEQPAPGWRELGVARPGDRPEHECLLALRGGHRLTSRAWCGRDADYTLRGPGLHAEARQLADEPEGTGALRGPLREVFRWRGDRGAALAQPEQGRATVRATPASPDAVGATSARQMAHVRLQQLTQHAGRVRVHGPVRGVAPGYQLLLRDHRLAANAQSWLVLHARLLLREYGQESAEVSRLLEQAVLPAAESEGGFGDAGRAWSFAGADAAPGDAPWGVPQACEMAGDGQAPLGGSYGGSYGGSHGGPHGGPRAEPQQPRGGWQLHASLLLQSASCPLRPDLEQGKPRIAGVQSAVVAHADDPAARAGVVHTDRLGRVRVRMPWDPHADPMPSSLDGTQQGRTRLAPSTTVWIRMATPWAGRAMGQTFPPRLGQQLLVGFVDGDPERPLGLGALYHAEHAPAWEMPRNRALTGWHSGELPTGGQREAGSSHLLLDDTPGAPQAQLACSHLDSSLALGCLGHVERGAGLGRARGHGAELRTDGHALLHSARGLLASSHARDDERGAAADARETLLQMQRAGRWHAAADEPEGADGAARSVSKQLAQTLRSLGGGGAPSLAAPCVLPNRDLLLAGAQGYAMAGDADLHLATTTHLGMGAGEQFGVHAGADCIASSAGSMRLLAHRLGVRLLAAAGPLHAHACGGTLNATAGNRILLDSAGSMLLQAAHGVLLQGGASFLRLTEGGTEYGTPGRFVSRSASMALPASTSL